VLALFIFTADEIPHPDMPTVFLKETRVQERNFGRVILKWHYRYIIKNFDTSSNSKIELISSRWRRNKFINFTILAKNFGRIFFCPKNSSHEVVTLFTHNASGSRSGQRHLNKTLEFWYCSSTSVYIRFFQPFHPTGKMLRCIFLPKFALYHLSLTSKSVC